MPPEGEQPSSEPVVHPAVHPSELRKFMRAFPTGVTVVTTLVDGLPQAMTANSFTSVSLDPVLILVCFKKDTRTGAGVLATGRLVVNLLDESQERLARRFAVSGVDRFDDVPYRVNDQGIPILADALGHLDCRVDTVHEAGTHWIVIAAVEEMSIREGPPLLFHEGTFRGLGVDRPPGADRTP